MPCASFSASSSFEPNEPFFYLENWLNCWLRWFGSGCYSKPCISLNYPERIQRPGIQNKEEAVCCLFTRFISSFFNVLVLIVSCVLFFSSLALAYELGLPGQIHLKSRCTMSYKTSILLSLAGALAGVQAQQSAYGQCGGIGKSNSGIRLRNETSILT